MSPRLVQLIQKEPRPPAPKLASRWESVLWTFLSIGVVVEASFKPNVDYRFAQACGGLFLIAPLFFRLKAPFLAFIVSFAAASAVPVAVLLFDVHWVDLDSTASILVLAYTLFRWGSGREGAIGLFVLLALYGLTLIRAQYATAGEAIAGGVVMLFPALLGVTFRFRARVQLRELDAVRLRERERLARDLHDSVAHHVSAIALQAQGGIAMAGKEPEVVVKVLHVIEEAASHALKELRGIVSALRETGEAALGPQSRLVDILDFRSDGAHGLIVRVEFTGEPDGVPGPIQAAVFRVVQESLTNVRRHAQGASEVNITLRVSDVGVDLQVRDDGRSPSSPRAASPGYGVVGMKERATLLGGSLTAGPQKSGGWCVEAHFPLGDKKS